MKYAWIVLGVILFVGISFAWRKFANSHDEDLFDEDGNRIGGFREWVRNPRYKRRVERAFAQRDKALKSLRLPKNLSDSDIAGMVEQLFHKDCDKLNVERLKLIGERAKPHLVKALDDPRVTKRFVTDDFIIHGPNYPLQRIHTVLEPLDSKIMIETLTTHIKHDDERMRKYAAGALCKAGTPECIEPALTALADEESYVRSSAMMGIRHGMNDNACSPEFLKTIFPALVKLLNRRDESAFGDAPVLLLAIDTGKALPILLSTEYFTIENRELHYIIGALNAADQIIPHELLLPLLKQLKPRSDAYPYSYCYAEALRAYARNPDEAAEQTFRAELNAANKRVQEGAAESLGILVGIEDSRGYVFESQKNLGFEGLTVPQQVYITVFLYDAEVNNGGHSQFFVNSWGNHWKTALSGLRAIGAPERAAILQDAVDLFGPAGPSENDRRRHKQLARLSESQHEAISGLDDRYYACKENVEALLFLYAIDHVEHFRAGE